MCCSRRILIRRGGRVGVALAGVALTGFTIAQPASGHPGGQSVALAAIHHSADYPSPGSRAVYAGTVSGKLGRGAIVDRITITGHPKLTTFTFKGTSTGFYPHGTSRSRITGLATVRRDGSVALAGHGHYAGGTDSYRHARGSYSFTGTAPALPPIRQPPPCAVSAGWKVVARDSQVVVVLKQPDYPIEEYRYCSYAHAAQGFQLLSHNDDSALLGGEARFSTVDGVALSYLLYHSGTTADSPVAEDQGSSHLTYMRWTRARGTVSIFGKARDKSPRRRWPRPERVPGWSMTLRACRFSLKRATNRAIVLLRDGNAHHA